MADRYYSLNFGQSAPGDVAETGSTTAAAHVEVRVTYDATGNSKQALLNALEAIEGAVTQDTWPPA